jgi:hypothetical protein
MKLAMAHLVEAKADESVFAEVRVSPFSSWIRQPSPQKADRKL